MHLEDSSRSRRPEEIADRLYREDVERRKQVQERLESERQVGQRMCVRACACAFWCECEC